MSDAWMWDTDVRLGDKLYRALKDQKLFAWPSGYTKRATRRAVDAIVDAPRFVIDEVAEYWGTTKERWDARKDFPCVLPPYPLMWIETNAPSHCIIGGHGDTSDDIPAQWGALVGLYTEDEARARAPRNYTEQKVGSFAYCIRALVLSGPMRAMGAGYITMLGTYTWHCDDAGSIVLYRDESGEEVTGYWEIVPPPSEEEKGPEYMGRVVSAATALLIHPLQLGLSFLHCRNIEIAERVPTPASARATTQQYGVPSTKHTVIHVMPRAQRRALERINGLTAKGRQPPRLHMVRGHFCHRRKPGTNLKQLWWRNAFLKGDAARGAIAHDAYMIET